jgi:hypothetical protein
MSVADETVPVDEAAPADAEKGALVVDEETVVDGEPVSGPGATYMTPMHPNGVKDTSSTFKGPLGMEFNPCVSLGSIVLIAAFAVWCIVHTACDANDFSGTCSIADLNKEECLGLAQVCPASPQQQ